MQVNYSSPQISQENLSKAVLNQAPSVSAPKQAQFSNYEMSMDSVRFSGRAVADSTLTLLYTPPRVITKIEELWNDPKKLVGGSKPLTAKTLLELALGKRITRSLWSEDHETGYTDTPRTLEIHTQDKISNIRFINDFFRQAQKLGLLVEEKDEYGYYYELTPRGKELLKQMAGK